MFLHPSVILFKEGSAPVHAGIHPQAATPLLPRSRHPPGTDGYCCGRYASYWNAFLFHKRLSFCSQVGGMHARGACVPRGWGHAYLGGYVAGGVRGMRDGHCSGRYASYWNAFLLRGHFEVFQNAGYFVTPKV